MRLLWRRWGGPNACTKWDKLLGRRALDMGLGLFVIFQELAVGISATGFKVCVNVNHPLVDILLLGRTWGFLMKASLVV